MPAAPPTKSALDAFLKKCESALPGTDVGDYRTRCIGWNQETATKICEHVVAREKTGTFSLPWLHAINVETKPDIGDFVILLDYDGGPQALLQTVGLTLLPFKDIDETHTGLDGPSVRDLKVWRGIHTNYWNGLLEPLGKEVGDDLPVVVERFDCLYPRA